MAERAVVMAPGHPAVQTRCVKYMRAGEIPDLVLFVYHVQAYGALGGGGKGRSATAAHHSTAKEPLADRTHHIALSKTCEEAFCSCSSSQAPYGMDGAEPSSMLMTSCGQ